MEAIKLHAVLLAQPAPFDKREHRNPSTSTLPLVNFFQVCLVLASMAPMHFLPWLRQPDNRTRLPGLLLLGLASIWAVARVARSMRILFDRSHDLDIYYSLWFLLKHRDYADVALSQALYLPHTWIVLTPLFLFGWPAARLLMIAFNLASICFLWWRLSRLLGLQGIRRGLLLAFFSGWLATGLVLGLGNLALVCVATAVAAFPFKTTANSAFLALSAMKQTLVFPLYLHLIFKRPRILILPFAVFAACGLAALFWARLSFTEGFKLAKGVMDTANAWTFYDFTCMRRLLVPLLKGGLPLTLAVWGIWFALFGGTIRIIKEPLTQLAALLLLSLLPMYHQKYDLVAAVPALAIFLRHCSLLWPTLMTISLASDFGTTFSRFLPAGSPQKLAQVLESAYYPLLILLILAGLFYVDTRAKTVPLKDSTA